MVDVKKVEKTAESSGFQNVAPGLGDKVVVDTAVRQAAATVPGTEAAAGEAMPSDEAMQKELEMRPNNFRDSVREREDAVRRGEEPSNEAYPAPHREVKPSKRTEQEQKRGAQAQADAAHQQPGSTVPADVASRAAKEYNRNKAAEQQVERVLGVEDAPLELKARPSEPPGVDTTESGGQVPEKSHEKAHEKSPEKAHEKEAKHPVAHK